MLGRLRRRFACFPPFAIMQRPLRFQAVLFVVGVNGIGPGRKIVGDGNHPSSLLPDWLTRFPASYTAAKRALLANTSLQDDVKTHMLSSLVAGTVATTICAPADVLKSRIQAASKSGAGSSVSLLNLPPYP